jgi:hypothetical protein
VKVIITIIKSAVKHNGVVYVGKRHSDAIKSAYTLTGHRPITSEQGFLTSDGKFVTRTEGAKIALKAKQITSLRFGKTELFSEDLW